MNPTAKVSVEVWARSYHPFRCGGNVNEIHKAIIEVDEKVELAHGVSVYVLHKHGREFIFDAESGGLIGDDLEQVRKDVAEADPELIYRQIVKAVAEKERAVEQLPQTFLLELEHLLPM